MHSIQYTVHCSVYCTAVSAYLNIVVVSMWNDLKTHWTSQYMSTCIKSGRGTPDSRWGIDILVTICTVYLTGCLWQHLKSTWTSFKVVIQYWRSVGHHWGGSVLNHIIQCLLYAHCTLVCNDHCFANDGNYQCACPIDYNGCCYSSYHKNFFFKHGDHSCCESWECVLMLTSNWQAHGVVIRFKLPVRLVWFLVDHCFCLWQCVWEQ